MSSTYAEWMFGDEAVGRRNRAAAHIISLLKTGDFTAGTLQQLVDILGHERLCKAYKDPNLVALNLHWIERSLLDISECLVPNVTSSAHLERELQARALSSALGLLYAYGVQNFAPHFFQRLDAQLKERFEDLQLQSVPFRSGAFSAENFRQLQCAYYLCSGASFARRFSQGRPIAIEAIRVAVASISFAFAIGCCVGGFGSPNLGELVNSLRTILSPIQPRKEERFETLYSVQELTRMVLASHWIACESEALRTAPSDEISVLPAGDDLRPIQCSRRLAQVLLDKIITILGSKPYDTFESWATAPSNIRLDFLAAFNQGPPQMNEFFYIYGLLDCAAQICRIIPSSKLSVDAMSRVARIIRRSPEPSLRCKGVEILLSNSDDREQNYIWLLEPKVPWPGGVTAEIDVAYSCLNEESEILLSRTSTVIEISSPLNAAPPLICGAGPPPSAKGPRYPEEEGQLPKPDLNPGEDIAFELVLATGSGSSAPSSNLPGSDPPSQSSNPPEQDEKTGGPCPYPGREEKFHLSPPRRGRHSTRSAHIAGISPNGSVAFLMSERMLQLCPVLCTERGVVKQTLLDEVAPSGQEFKSATLSDKHIAVLSNRDLMIFDYTRSRLLSRGPLATIQSDGRGQLDCVAIQETARETLIAVGGRQLLQRFLTIYQLRGRGSLSILYQLDAPLQSDVELSSSFKGVSFARDGSRLISITYGNRAYVWGLNGADASSKCYGLPYRKYTTETNALGLTSATLFHTHSSRPWALITTSPSSERFSNEGEYSYLAPISPDRTDLAGLGCLAHDLTELPKYNSTILAGAVSDPPHYAALLERSGRIFLLRLDRDMQSGSLTTKGPPRELNMHLKEQRSALGVAPTSIRFCNDETGLKLLAIDVFGNVVRMSFD